MQQLEFYYKYTVVIDCREDCHLVVRMELQNILHLSHCNAEVQFKIEMLFRKSYFTISKTE